MNMFAQVALLAWLPLVVFAFNLMSPKKAVANLFVASYLFVPDSGFGVPGLPDYTKTSATVVGLMFCLLVFDQTRFLSFRPRWFDIPMAVWCFGNVPTALANDLGIYEASSAFLQSMVEWGLPYLIGRIYLNDLEALKELAIAIAIGGLFYVPLCLIELRLSPIIQSTIYGIQRWDGLRYGGYRPKVFLTTGLVLGMWMTNATFLGYVLWSSKSIRVIRSYPFGLLLLALTVTTIACKSTGALVLLAVGVTIFWVIRRTQWTPVLWLMIAISPIYCVTRTFDLWSGQDIVSIAKSTVGEERAQSFDFRLENERKLADHALKRPILGWGRQGRSLIVDAWGKLTTVPDGLWIIVLGNQGLLGLASFLVLFLQPIILIVRRFPVAMWRDPMIGPTVGLAMMLMLVMLDNLSNATMMPIYPLVIGGIAGLLPYRPSVGHVEAEDALSIASEFAGEGRMAEACLEFRRAIDLASTSDSIDARRIHAEAFDGLGHSLMACGQFDEAAIAFRDALAIRDGLAVEFADDDHFRDLAIARDGLSRALAESGRMAMAIEERQIALQIWEILATNHPKNSEYRARRVDNLNDLAWLLATDPSPTPHDPSLALAMAEKAVQLSPDQVALWNTLGVACYRAGDWSGAIESLERSVLSSPDGAGTAFDFYFLAMAWYQLHREDQGLEWLERGIAWAARHRPGHPVLERFRNEAESLLRDAHDGIGQDLP